MAHTLYCYRTWLKREAHEAYQRDMTIWANLAPHAEKKLSPPEMPKILKQP